MANNELTLKEIDAIATAVAEKLQMSLLHIPPEFKARIIPNMYLHPCPVYMDNHADGMIELKVGSDRSITMYWYNNNHDLIKQVTFT